MAKMTKAERTERDLTEARNLMDEARWGEARRVYEAIIARLMPKKKDV